MKRIFYSLLFAGTVWTAASQNPPEIKAEFNLQMQQNSD